MAALPSTEIWVRAQAQIEWNAKIDKRPFLVQMRLAANFTCAELDADQIAEDSHPGSLWPIS